MTKNDDHFLQSFFSNDLFDLMNDFIESSFDDIFDQYPFRVDVYDKQSAFVIEAELPNFEKDQISVDVFGENVSIKAFYEESTETLNDNNHTYHKEQSYSSFERIIPMPYYLSAHQAKASFTDGLLSIYLPKHQNHKPVHQKIEID